MTFTIDLPSDVADRLARRAAQDGEDVAGYMQRLAARDVGVWDASALAGWDSLLDSFAEGEAADHQETIEVLARTLNEDRPGQRRVFGEGINPSHLSGETA
jgi:predicted transcriptional regulator